MPRAVRPPLVLIAAVAALFSTGVAHAATADEQALAEKFAPVVRLVEQREECGPGEPFVPLDVDVLFDERTVALRGPWNPVDLVKIAPVATDIVGLYDFHLDFPGEALDPGCDYERWARRIGEGSVPTVYAHVTTEPARPGQLALQYWLFYAFNDFNNLHEGDWEMIQLLFDADDAAQALTKLPAEVGYSSHEGAERARWGDEKLEVVRDTHPVVYPAAGSHANKFTQALYLGSSAEAGVGCDDTRGPHTELTPRVVTIPSDPGAAGAALPWIGFEGRWGELQKAFFNGPTGPNMKTQWDEPLTWADEWRDRSYAVPTGGLFGTSATDVFCGGVATVSAGLVRLLRSPAPTIAALAIVLGLVALVVILATWRPAAPLRVARRRAWGQVLSASARMYVEHPRLLLGLGVIFIPLTIAVTLVQWLLYRVFDVLGAMTGEPAGTFALAAFAAGTTLALLGLALIQAATALALVELDAGRPVGARRAFRLALRRVRPLLGAAMVYVVCWLVLSTTTILIPVAIWLSVRWALLAPIVVLEDRSAWPALRRSARLVRGRWLRVASLVGVAGIVALASGPLLGAVLILVTAMPLAFLNLVAGLVYAVTLPFVALATAYVYFDARVRVELDEEESPSELPAEIDLGTVSP